MAIINKLSMHRLAGTCLALCAMLTISAASPPDDQGSWPVWGNTLAQSRYSTADQINTSNVTQLKPAWVYKAPSEGIWETTPILVNGTLYLTDPDGAAVAMEPESGRVLWRFEPGVAGKMRGLSWWPGDAQHGPRIIHTLADRIYALEPATGRPITGFGGPAGYIDLSEGVAEKFPSARLIVTSPATIVGNLLVVAGSTSAFQFNSKGPSPDPRAYDVITGRKQWQFNIVPRPGQANAGTWGEDGWRDRAGPSAWGIISADPALGLIYVPIGNASAVYVGIDRPGDNLYASSIVALDARTGKYRWHFQTTHHDIFDYDVAAPPALVDLNVKGRKVPALVQVTKVGLMFILDRRTGKPIFGVEERPVPRSEVPGEKSSPTQPFPLKPLPLAKLGMKFSDITSITPEVHRYCVDKWNREGFRDTEVFTPHRLNGPSLFMPGNAGGAGGIWGGVSIDPSTGYIYVNTNNSVVYSRLVSDGKGGYKSEGEYTPFATPQGWSCVQPPWGEMIAVSGNTGDIAWRRLLGSAELYGDVGNYTGAVSIGGSMATGGNLVFIGGTMRDRRFRAYDARSGTELWTVRMESFGSGTPMTFVGHNGRQYVLVATGERGHRGVLIAFALPKDGDPDIDLGAKMPDPLRPEDIPAIQPLRTTAMDVKSSIVNPLLGTDNITDLPIGPGREDLGSMCTNCHGLGTITAMNRSAPEWRSTIQDMRYRGAQGDDATSARVLSYLTRYFGEGL